MASKCIATQVATAIVAPIIVIAGIVNLAPPSIASWILNPEKIMEIAQYKQKKDEEKSVKQAQKLIKDDIKSETGNLLHNAFDPSFGASKEQAKLTIVEYLDYRCGYCKKAHTVLSEVLKNEKYKDKIRVVVKNYPVIGGEASLYAAEVATAFFKKNPEKFIELHEKLFATNITSPADVDAVLKSFGAKYSDIKNEEARQAIIQNFNFARSINVSGTPAFVVGDELVGGFMTYDQFAQKIDEKLSK